MPRKAKSAASAPVDSPLFQLMQTMSGQLAGLSDRLTRMETKVAAVEQATPRIIPRIDRPDNDQGQVPTLVGVAMEIGEPRNGVIRQATVDTTGARVMGYQRWIDGTKVKLNTNKVSLDLAKAANFDPETIGEVITFHFYSETKGEGKYRVRFPGLTDARGDGFYESDLITV